MIDEMFEVIGQPISVEKVMNKVRRRDCGAITTFIGTVREWTGEKRTMRLEYQAYAPMAVKKMAEIAEEVEEKWPGAETAITHRTGTLEISDIAVVIAVSCPHRKEAYEANAYVMERMKEMVPIWKKEYWEDGTEWVGDQLETKPYPEGKPERRT
ncbi:molybdenum cofactor biosynthesis protein MoaE [Alteribacillus sp. HJP-4]|uniref:molybdenum cofactor biosynthesis protein MoaE n=1 Tax=Alteribacillus sp. HJP-4 TaxID=2775394 RepID=UPI0035CCF703